MGILELKHIFFRLMFVLFVLVRDLPVWDDPQINKSDFVVFDVYKKIENLFIRVSLVRFRQHIFLLTFLHDFFRLYYSHTRVFVDKMLVFFFLEIW